jgi:hypothetical protein
MALLSSTFNLNTVRDQIPYTEKGDYRIAIRGGEAQEAVRVLQCNWSQSQALIQAMLPRVAVGPSIGTIHLNTPNNPEVTTANRLSLLRYDPEPHPRYPWLYAVHGEDMEGLGVISQDPSSFVLSYRDLNAVQPNGLPIQNTGYAKVQITYKPLPFGQALSTGNATNDAVNASAGDDGSGVYECCRYTSVRTKGSIKSLKVAGGIFRYAKANLGPNPANPAQQNNVFSEIPDASVAPAPIIHMAYTWYAVPSVPAVAYGFMGLVNYYNFDTLARKSPLAQSNFPIGTVIYHYPEVTDPYPMCDGTSVVDVTYHFSYNPNGWNCFYRPSMGGAWIPGYRGTPSINPTVKTYYGSTGVIIENPAAAGTGQNGPPNNDPHYRWNIGYNLLEYADLNLLFTIIDQASIQ